MMRLLYPLIASSLITITPFLLTFEKGQNIVRGLFGYSEFAILLLLAFIKTHFKLFEGTPKHWFCGIRPCFSRKFIAIVASIIFFVLLFLLLIFVAWIDLLNLLAIKGWTLSWYGVLPFVTCFFAVVMLWNTRGYSLTGVSYILFISLVIHWVAYNYYPTQPLAQFPIVDYFARSVPNPSERKKLPKDFNERFSAAYKQIIVTDSTSITKNYVDTLRSNVVVLVESWGIPMDVASFSEELAVFKGLPMQVGVHHRMYSRTRTAEREDLLAFWSRDTNGRRDSTFLPSEFAKRGYTTAFFFGGDSLEHERYKYIKKIGFENVVWGAENVKNDKTAMFGLVDSLMAVKLNMYLAQTNDTLQNKSPLFLAWTTRDTKFPLLGFSNVYSSTADEVDLVYTERLMGTLRLVANLAHLYPNVRFIVQGDHEPILSPRSFQERFYKRWVPYVVLN